MDVSGITVGWRVECEVGCVELWGASLGTGHAGGYTVPRQECGASAADGLLLGLFFD